MARAALGERTAFAALVRKHQRPLFGFLGRMGLSQAEAEEVAQDTFLRAWQHLDRFDASRAAFSTWIYTIARRLALDVLDRAEHRCRVHDGNLAADMDGALPAFQDGGSAGCPLETLVQQRQRGWLQAALHTLPLADRSILASAYLQDMSLAQVAHIEGLTPAAAKARLHRARQRLRAALGTLDPQALAPAP